MADRVVPLADSRVDGHPIGSSVPGVISRRAFNRGLLVVLGGFVTVSLVGACGGGGPVQGHNIRPTSTDGSGDWQLVSSGQQPFVAQLGTEADIVPATDIGLPNKPNSQGEQSAINDLANNQLVYFTNRTSFDPSFFDNSNSLSRNYAIKDIYTLNNENGGKVVYLKPVAGDPLNNSTRTVVDSSGRRHSAGIYYGFTDATGRPIVLDPAQNQISRTINPNIPLTQQYILGNNVRLHLP